MFNGEYMRYLPFLLLLIGCTDNLENWFAKAKNNPDHRVCSNITAPTEIAGKYCIQYIIR